METPPVSWGSLRLFRLLAWVHWRSFVTRLRGLRRQSRLLLFVLSSFVIGYLLIGYWLFHRGLEYLYQFPLVGALLSQRILFLVFAFFFMMLVFSNLIIGYSTLFKNRETAWLLSLPVPHRNIYRWKFVEALAVSSWALVFLSAPMMVAYGGLHRVAPLFYLEVTLCALPFVVLPALLGSWMIVFLVRILARPWVKKTAMGLAALTVLALLFGIKPVTDTEAASGLDVASFDQLLKHTRVGLNPFLPSSWLARSVLAWSENLVREGVFYFLVLSSNALMGLLVGFELVGNFFYGSWTVSMSARAEELHRKAEANRLRAGRGFMDGAIHALPFFSRPVKSLILKDVRIFWRDPAQWTQFMIFFGLLCIYVANLRNVAFNFQSESWETMISYLNLAASALTLSTLTTRFVFPQFSLEGRRLWIIGLAPVSVRKLLFQKFFLSCTATALITITLMTTSSIMLHLSAAKVLFFATSIALMSAALSGLAVGLGAVFPNFKEDDPSKIVSGFGGTLCLVISFIYIVAFISLAAMPALRHITGSGFFPPDGVALALALLLSAAMMGIPMAAGIRRVKNLEI